MKIREKLKFNNIRITELAYYLEISRPTLYTYLELYENKEYSKMEKRFYDVFKYIDETKDMSKPQLINYMINNKTSSTVSVEIDKKELINQIIELSQKTKQEKDDLLIIISSLVTTTKLDFLIKDLVDLIENNNISENLKKLKERG